MDAVDIFVRALKNLKRNKPDIFRNPKFFRLNETFNNGSRKVFCEPRPDQVQIKPWALGNMIVEAIKKVCKKSELDYACLLGFNLTIKRSFSRSILQNPTETI